MPNIVEQWLLGRRNSVSNSVSHSVSKQSRGTDATTRLLRRIIPACSSCHQPLDGHSYRFYASHPLAPTDALDSAPADFLQAIHAEDWATVQANQQPALDQPLFVLYAIACPHVPADSGMVALLLTQPDLQIPDTLFHHLALTPQSMAALRAQCPTCPWTAFTPSPQFQQDTI